MKFSNASNVLSMCDRHFIIYDGGLLAKINLHEIYPLLYILFNGLPYYVLIFIPFPYCPKIELEIYFLESGNFFTKAKSALIICIYWSYLVFFNLLSNGGVVILKRLKFVFMN